MAFTIRHSSGVICVPMPAQMLVAGLARQLGTTWRTVWRPIKPLLEIMAEDPARFENVTLIGRR